MTYMSKTIVELRAMLDKGEITEETLFNEAKELAYKYQDVDNSFVTILNNYEFDNSNKSVISGIPYALKDNFSTKGILTTGSSNILKNYIPVFNSTVYEKLKNAGGILVGKTVLDELAVGGSGISGHTGIVKNPWDKERLIGGSSAGSVAAVVRGIVPFAIGSDTGDSIRKPAGWGGIIGYKPTYGLISRHGLFAFASSMDHVGTLTRTIKDVAPLLDILKGKDKNDMVTYDDNTNYSKELTKNVNDKKMFYVKEFSDAIKINSDIYDNFIETLEKLKSLGIEVCEVSIDKDLLKSIYPAWFAIACAEATSNNSNLTGILFGTREEGNSVDEIIFNSRTKGFSEFIKRRFIIGSYVLQRENQEKLFKNAGRIRRMVVDKINDLFKEYDAFIMPVDIDIAPRFDDKIDKLSDEYLVLNQAMSIGNFGGFPSLTIPSGMVRDMPVAVNITGPVKKDLDVLNIGYALEEKINFKYFTERGE